jgi:hypothetical protein
MSTPDQPPKGLAGHGGGMQWVGGVWVDRYGNELCRESVGDALRRLRGSGPKPGLVTDHEDPFEDNEG